MKRSLAGQRASQGSVGFSDKSGIGSNGRSATHFVPAIAGPPQLMAMNVDAELTSGENGRKLTQVPKQLRPNVQDW